MKTVAEYDLVKIEHDKRNSIISVTNKSFCPLELILMDKDTRQHLESLFLLSKEAIDFEYFYHQKSHKERRVSLKIKEIKSSIYSDLDSLKEESIPLLFPRKRDINPSTFFRR